MTYTTYLDQVSIQKNGLRLTATKFDLKNSCSVTKSYLTATPWTAAYQASLSPYPRIFPRSCPLHWWYHPAISSSITLFWLCLQSFPASGSFPVSRLFAWGGQSIVASISASFLLMSIQGWFPLRLTGLISLLSKGLSRVSSSTTVQKHQFFGPLPSLRIQRIEQENLGVFIL